MLSPRAKLVPYILEARFYRQLRSRCHCHVVPIALLREVLAVKHSSFYAVLDFLCMRTGTPSGMVLRILAHISTCPFASQSRPCAIDVWHGCIRHIWPYLA
jgi:hypothetical protein